MTIPDPRQFSDARPKDWIERRAKELEQAVNLDLVERWPKHNHLTQHQLIEDVISKHLNAFWSYILIETFGKAPQIAITQYNGDVDES